MRFILILSALLLFVPPASAREISGITVAEKLEGAHGVELTLNGAGIRSKLFFKIYIAALYLEQPGVDASDILSADAQRKMVMHFLYDKVSKEKLVSAWNDGFAANLSGKELATLSPRIDTFNDLFTMVKAGDIVVLDYLPGTGTRITVAGNERGVIDGKDFSDAVFAIWLGEKPVTADLKKALLSYK